MRPRTRRRYKRFNPPGNHTRKVAPVPVIRRRVRRYRRRLYRRSRRWIFGPWIYVILAGSYYPYRFSQQELNSIEKTSGKSVETMNEAELMHSMQQNGIEQSELTEEELKRIDQLEENESADSKNSFILHYCSNCGSKITNTHDKFCKNCGSAF